MVDDPPPPFTETPSSTVTVTISDEKVPLPTITTDQKPNDDQLDLLPPSLPPPLSIPREGAGEGLEGLEHSYEYAQEVERLREEAELDRITSAPSLSPPTSSPSSFPAPPPRRRPVSTGGSPTLTRLNSHSPTASTSSLPTPAPSSSLPPPPPRRVKPPVASTSRWPTPVTSHGAPPKRTIAPAKAPLVGTPDKETWSQWSKRKGYGWGSVALVKGVAISDKVGTRLNGWAEVMGSERFYPVTGDFPQEMEKCARILRAFTVDGVEHNVEVKTKSGAKKQKRVAKKIPAKIIREAKGLAIFTSMRSGIAPFGGAGGAGVVVAKLDDGTWSAPAAITPNNLSAGFMLGVDIYDAILIIRTQAALDSFSTHKATLGSEIGVAAGPYGAGAAAELGVERSPVLSYVRSRGLYAGVEVVGQVFVVRAEENEMMYYWPGISAKDILQGRVKVPECAASLQTALIDAETGKAQLLKGVENEFEEPLPSELIDSVELEEGEILRLPPTPTQTIEEEEEELKRLKEMEEKGIKETKEEFVDIKV